MSSSACPKALSNAVLGAGTGSVSLKMDFSGSSKVLNDLSGGKGNITIHLSIEHNTDNHVATRQLTKKNT